jgi:hypothetical protein
MALHNYVSFMGTLGAALLAVAIDRRPEEVGAWVQATRVDVVVLGEVTHGGRQWRSVEKAYNGVSVFTRTPQDEGRGGRMAPTHVRRSKRLRVRLERGGPRGMKLYWGR